MNESSFPKILLINPHIFNQQTGGGVALTKLFWGWPADRIAALYTDGVEPDQRVCQQFYRLGDEEMRYVGPLEWARRIVRQRAGQATPAATITPRSSTAPSRSSAPAAVLTAIKAWLLKDVVGDSLPQRFTLSPALRRFLDDYHPELIYTSLGSLVFMQAVETIADQYHLPLAIHIMDDWPSTLHRRGWLAPLLRPQIDPLLRRLIKRAAVCTGISEAMSAEYLKRYGRSFQPFPIPLDLSNWRTQRRQDYAPNHPFRLLYSGSILPNAQLGALQDVAAAVGQLRAAGADVELHLHAPPYVAQYTTPFAALSGVRLGPAPDDAGVIPLYTGADVLVLPSNFDSETIQYLHLSMPSKIPACMASGTPILVYGPAAMAQVQYAQREGWGCVVDQQKVSELAAAIQRLMQDEALREQLGRRAVEVVGRNHDAAAVRPAFQRALCETVRPSPPAPLPQGEGSQEDGEGSGQSG